jgi:hypothetical protein
MECFRCFSCPSNRLLLVGLGRPLSLSPGPRLLRLLLRLLMMMLLSSLWWCCGGGGWRRVGKKRVNKQKND